MLYYIDYPFILLLYNADLRCRRQKNRGKASPAAKTIDSVKHHKSLSFMILINDLIDY